MPHLNNSKYVFFYRVEREKEGGGLFCLCFLTYLGYKTLGEVYGLTSCCEQARRNTFKHSWDKPPWHCVLKWGFTRTFPGNQDATSK